MGHNTITFFQPTAPLAKGCIYTKYCIHHTNTGTCMYYMHPWLKEYNIVHVQHGPTQDAITSSSSMPRAAGASQINSCIILYVN